LPWPEERFRPNVLRSVPTAGRRDKLQTLIVVFCCIVACPLAMMAFMWWLDRNPKEVEMRREVRRLEKAKAKREEAALTDQARRTETPSR